MRKHPNLRIRFRRVQRPGNMRVHIGQPSFSVSRTLLAPEAGTLRPIRNRAQGRLAALDSGNIFKGEMF